MFTLSNNAKQLLSSTSFFSRISQTIDLEEFSHETVNDKCMCHSRR